MASTPSPSLKCICKYISCQKLNQWTVDLTVKLILSVCELETSSFPVTNKQHVWITYWTRTGFRTRCDVPNQVYRPSTKNLILIEHRETFHFLQINVKSAFQCQTLHIYHSYIIHHSEAQTSK